MEFTEAGLALQIALAFGGGIIAFLSPCVLPLLPGYLGLMSGYSVAEMEGGAASRRRMLRVTSLFVLGFTLVFVATGAAATQISRFLSSNQTVTNRIAGAVVILFGVLMIGMAFTNRGLFGFLARERRLEVRPSRLGSSGLGSFAPSIMGIAFGFGWSPCIGTVLGGVLGLAATRDTVGQGMFLLLVFSLGLGVPFVLAGLGLARAFSAVRSLRRWIRPVNVAAGGLMVAFGAVLLTNNIGRLSGFFVEVFLRVPFLEHLASI